MDPNGKLSDNNQIDQLTNQESNCIYLEKNVTDGQINNKTQKETDLQNMNLKEDKILHKSVIVIIFIILFLIFSTIISDVLIGQVVDWINNNTQDDSPGKTLSILLFIIDSIVILYYTIFISKFINDMYDNRQSNKFNYRLGPIIFIYLLMWTPRIAVYIEFVSYMKEEKYNSLNTFDTIFFEFIFGIVIHFIFHIIHFISIILFSKKLTVYRLRNDNKSTCYSIEYC